MQLCYVVKLYRPFDPSRLIWGLVLMWHGLNVSFVCEHALSGHLVASWSNKKKLSF